MLNSLPLKTASKRGIQKTAEATGDLIGNRIADKFIRASKTSPQNNLETNEEEILLYIFIYIYIYYIYIIYIYIYYIYVLYIYIYIYIYIYPELRQKLLMM